MTGRFSFFVMAQSDVQPPRHAYSPSGAVQGFVRRCAVSDEVYLHALGITKQPAVFQAVLSDLHKNAARGNIPRFSVVPAPQNAARQRIGVAAVLHALAVALPLVRLSADAGNGIREASGIDAVEHAPHHGLLRGHSPAGRHALRDNGKMSRLGDELIRAVLRVRRPVFNAVYTLGLVLRLRLGAPTAATAIVFKPPVKLPTTATSTH